MSLKIDGKNDGAEKAKKVEKPLQDNGPVVISKVIKGDTYFVISDAASEIEDEFVNLYLTSANTGGLVLQPTYEPRTLSHIVKHQSMLLQCVQAMEVNIDGTGHEFVPREKGGKIDESELRIATSFFNEPYPGESFVKQRRLLRTQMESQGWAFLEVLRTLDGKVSAVRNVESSRVRLVKLDDPVEAIKVVERDGKDVALRMMVRERRYVQLLNGTQKVYYAEFGASRQLNKHTGQWAEKGKSIAPEDRATELLMFGIEYDPSNPYPQPRWINNTPSAIGTRKAEEDNLTFLDSGGMPPAIIFIEGGQMVKTSAEALRTYLSPKNKSKANGVVVELISSSGSLESSGTVKAHVESFGSAKVNDAMFTKYTADGEERLRVSFRLPPLFLGKAQDYNFATAQVAYMVAEAQVFQPERTEFDEQINRTLIRALGLKTLKFKSNPITLKSVDDQLKGLTMVESKIEGEEFVSQVAAITGISATYSKEAEERAMAAGAALGQSSGAEEQNKPSGERDDTTGTPTTAPGDKKPTGARARQVAELARKFAQATGLMVTKHDLPPGESDRILEEVAKLSDWEQAAFHHCLTVYTPSEAHACHHG